MLLGLKYKSYLDNMIDIINQNTSYIFF